MANKKKSSKINNKQSSEQVTFICDLNTEANEVYLAGNFNGWDPRSDRMYKRNGCFQKIKQLPKGEYQYKFVVDGEWHGDPKASLQVPNEHGSANSLIKV